MKYAFVCSGGGVMGIEAIGGMIESLRDNHNITPDRIYACSGGSIPSALYYKNIDLMPFFKSYKVTDMIKIRSLFDLWRGKSLYDSNNMKQLFEELIGYDFNKKLVVNVTDKLTRNTCYVYGNCISVMGSMAIPEVFDSQYITADGWIIDTSYQSEDVVRSARIIPTTLNQTEVYDGGVYDICPIPPIDQLNDVDRVIVLMCSESKNIDLRTANRVQRAVDAIMATTEREYKDTIRTYTGDKRFVLLRPNQFDAPLLDWSDNFGCYNNAYNYVKNVKF